MKRICSWNWLPVFGLMTLLGCESTNNVGVAETFSEEETEEFVTVEVIDGRHAAEGTYPFKASLQGPDGYLCGNILLTPSYIFTAAHCVDTLLHGSDW